MNRTAMEGVVVVYQDNKVVAMIQRDEKTRLPVIYSCVAMNVEEVAALIDGKPKNADEDK